MKTEEILREEMATVCQKMWQLGWVAANDGNVSIKLSDGFLVTPSLISKSEVDKNNILRLDSSGNVIESERRDKNNFRPSSEFKMHLRCYNEREDVAAVIHAHPITATAFAAAGKAIDDYSVMETALTIGSVPVAPYATPSTDEVGDSIAPFLDEHDVLLLKNHGALTVGTDLRAAFFKMETLEHHAKILINLKILGGVSEITCDNLEKLFKLRKKYGLKGKHPGYKKF